MAFLCAGSRHPRMYRYLRLNLAVLAAAALTLVFLPEASLAAGPTELLRTRYRPTQAELDLAALILAGCPKELLAERSGKSGRVIKSHLQSIYRKTVNQDPRAANAGRGTSSTAWSTSCSRSRSGWLPGHRKVIYN